MFVDITEMERILTRLLEPDNEVIMLVSISVQNGMILKNIKLLIQLI